MIDSKHQKENTNKGPVGPSGLPDAILSLHVDHGLQSDAEKMARAASAAATTFKADHSELRIPWGDPPFPRRPRPGDVGETGDALESLARAARYRLIFDAMVRRRSHNQNHDHDHDRGHSDDVDVDEKSVRVLATGHHADDQVETVLMRLGAGSSMLGLGGMRSVRRFGMSLGRREGDFGWFGHEGLHRWIVRPLLDVPKVSLRSAPLPSCIFAYFAANDKFFFAMHVRRDPHLGQNSRDLRLAWYPLCARPHEFPTRPHDTQRHSPRAC
jgi:hypothetical protein